VDGGIGKSPYIDVDEVLPGEIFPSN